MRLQFITIANKGIPNQERIHLRVVSDANLSYYVVILSILAPGNLQSVYAGMRVAFWFPTHIVRTGDNVVLYTGQGTQTSNARSDGGTDHFFYWGLNSTMFNTPSACAVVMESSGWQTGF
jgi:ABC-type nitrate/sulfonate/bicarbonate transport system permease component